MLFLSIAYLGAAGTTTETFIIIAGISAAGAGAF